MVSLVVLSGRAHYSCERVSSLGAIKKDPACHRCYWAPPLQWLHHSPVSLLSIDIQKKRKCSLLCPFCPQSFARTVVRVQLPDGHIIESAFAPLDSVRDLHNAVVRPFFYHSRVEELNELSSARDCGLICNGASR